MAGHPLSWVILWLLTSAPQSCFWHVPCWWGLPAGVWRWQWHQRVCGAGRSPQWVSGVAQAMRKAASTMRQCAYVPLEQRDGYRASLSPQGQAARILHSLQVMFSHKDPKELGTLSRVVEKYKKFRTWLHLQNPWFVTDSNLCLLCNAVCLCSSFVVPHLIIIWRNSQNSLKWWCKAAFQRRECYKQSKTCLVRSYHITEPDLFHSKQLYVLSFIQSTIPGELSWSFWRNILGNSVPVFYRSFL